MEIDGRVSAAMRSQDRRRFLPPDVVDDHWRDEPLAIGYGQTNSQPTAVAQMLTLLEPARGMRMLDVGSGSGWTSAILGELGGPESRVFAVELVPQLVARSRAAVTQPWVTIHQGSSGRLGLPEFGPFDRILVSAMAETMPVPLVEQLADGGILVAPWASVMHRVRPGPHGVDVSQHGGYRFVPLR